jgi:hypothetical protein
MPKTSPSQNHPTTVSCPKCGAGVRARCPNRRCRIEVAPWLELRGEKSLGDLLCRPLADQIREVAS